MSLPRIALYDFDVDTGTGKIVTRIVGTRPASPVTQHDTARTSAVSVANVADVADLAG